MKKRDILIWLYSLKELKASEKNKIVEKFCEIEDLWYTSSKVIKNTKHLENDLLNKILKFRSEDYCNEEKEKRAKKGIKAITIYDEEYPKRLFEIKNKPNVLYSIGDIPNLNKSISVVGARKATYYGKWAAEKISGELAKKGVTVVSGMAAGIDTSAHRGSLKVDKRTVAVLGCGVDIIYPKANRTLYEEIKSRGTVLSEYYPGTEARKYHFPMRNRIISGITSGTLVVEAKEKSGSLITASFAAEQGRDVFAIPGNINSIYSEGTNKLIKDGAKLVESVEDIIEELFSFEERDQIKTSDTTRYDDLSETEIDVVKEIEKGPIHIDMISYNTNLKLQDLYGILVILEIKQKVRKMPGNIYTLI